MTSQAVQRVRLLTEMLARDGLFLLLEAGAFFRSRGAPVPDRKTIVREVRALEDSGQVASMTVSVLNKSNVSKTDYTVVYMPSRFPEGAGDKFMQKVNERLRDQDALRHGLQRHRLRESQLEADVRVERLSAAAAGALRPAHLPQAELSRGGMAALQQQQELERLATLRAFLQRYCGFLRSPLPMLIEVHGWLFRRLALSREPSPEELIDGIPFSLEELLGDMPVVTALRVASLEGVLAGSITAELVEQWTRPEVSGGRLADCPERHLIATAGFRTTLDRVVEIGSQIGRAHV